MKQSQDFKYKQLKARWMSSESRPIEDFRDAVINYQLPSINWVSLNNKELTSECIFVSTLSKL